MAQPEMMAIGNSLFNGVRSLTINASLAAWSAPAQVARALAIPFVTPDYPRNVVVNFERWLDMLAPWPLDIIDDFNNNIEFWNANPKSQSPEFDNIAIASSSYDDLLNRSASKAQTEIDGLQDQLKDITRAADFFFAYNTRFILNPQGDPAGAGFAPLDIVGRRQPGRLLVCIGANSGLWNMGFAAETSNGAIGGAKDTPFDADDIASLGELVKALKGLPAAIEHIYINTLPLPSTVADMMPVPDTSDTDKPGPNGLYPRYENSFGFNYQVLTREQVALNNSTVIAANNKLVDLIGDDPRIHVVAFDQVFTAYDFKTNPEASVVNVGDRVLSNLMFESDNPPFYRWRGGLIGLDGMHPTIVGYALMAQAILASIETCEGIPAANPIDLAAAFRADSLLTNPPADWDLFHDLALDVRRSLAGPAALAPTSPKFGPATTLMDVLGFKYD